MINTIKKNDVILNRVLCISYLINFQKNKIKTLFNFGSEFNTITLAFVSKLGIKIYSINISNQKNGGSTLKTFGMVLTSF